MDRAPTDAPADVRLRVPDLLLSRLHPPPSHPEMVARPRIDAALRRGRRGPLTLVTAPAGSGKTVAVAAWLRAERVTSAWLSLDADADEPVRFWAYLAAACDRLAPGCAEAVDALLQSDRPAPAALVAAVSNYLARLPWDGSPERPYVLVLDDYHAISQPALHDALSRLIAYLPPQVHLVITSRADPPLPLARIRARGQLAELRAADLRFSRDELAELRAAAGEPPLSETALARLEARTEGWAAGIQLALLALRDHPDPEGFVAAFAGGHRYLVDYLADEVLDQQPAHLRRFLLETAILDRLCAPLCDAVLGLGVAGNDAGVRASSAPFSQLLLDEAERRGLFLVALDNERRWYRYHHLFGDVLRVRLHALAPETLPALHRRAGDWYAAAAEREPALLPYAVRHTLAAGDIGRAADLVDRSAARIWNGGDMRAMHELLRLLPPEAVHARPRLGVALARATLSTGDLDAVASLLAQVTAALDAGTAADERRLRGWVAALAAHAARLRERPVEAFAQAAKALALLPEDDTAGRGFVTLGLAMSHHVASDLLRAAEHYHAAIPLLRAAGDRYHEVYAGAMLGTLTLMRGELGAAEIVLTGALERARVGGAVLPVAAMVHTALGEIAYLHDNLEGAQVHCTAALSLAELGQVRDAVLVGHELWVKIDLARGETAAAARRATSLLAHAETARIPQLVAWARSISAWVALAQGRTAEAAGWAATYQPAEGPLSPIRSDEFVTYLRMLLATGHAADARSLVDRQLPHAEAGGYVEQRLQLLVLGAIACGEVGDTARGHTWLAEAVAYAAPEDIRRPFLSAGPPILALLRALISANRLDDQRATFARRLAGAPRAPLPAPAKGHAPAPPDLVEQLTAREREILNLAAAGHSNQEIADILVIGVGTVKTHLHHVYGKLDARDRVGAIVRARALGLVV